MSIPITEAIAILSLLGMACSLSLAPLASFSRWWGRSTAGPSHYRTSRRRPTQVSWKARGERPECAIVSPLRLPGVGQMRRREILGVLGGAAAWPLVARAQQPTKVVRIGVLASSAFPPLQRFAHKLREHGYIEGQNLRFESRFAEGRDDRYPALAAELIAVLVDIIVTWGTSAAIAPQRAASSTGPCWHPGQRRESVRQSCIRERAPHGRAAANSPGAGRGPEQRSDRGRPASAGPGAP